MSLSRDEQDPIPEHLAITAADFTLDADGLTCGGLEPLIAQQIRRLAPGEVLEIQSDRAEASDGIRAWVALTGHTLLGIRTDPSSHRTSYFIRKKAHP